MHFHPMPHCLLTILIGLIVSGADPIFVHFYPALLHRIDASA